MEAKRDVTLNLFTNHKNSPLKLLNYWCPRLKRPLDLTTTSETSSCEEKNNKNARRIFSSKGQNHKSEKDKIKRKFRHAKWVFFSITFVWQLAFAFPTEKNIKKQKRNVVPLFRQNNLNIDDGRKINRFLITVKFNVGVKRAVKLKQSL